MTYHISGIPFPDAGTAAAYHGESDMNTRPCPRCFVDNPPPSYYGEPGHDWYECLCCGYLYDPDGIEVDGE